MNSLFSPGINFIFNHIYNILYLMQLVCVMLIVFYILFQSRILKKIEQNDSFKKKIKEISILIIVFGLLAIFSTYSGMRIDPNNKNSPIANVRDLATFIAGMLGGPVAGIGAGLIGGIHRFFYAEGAYSALPCSIATFLAGVMGGIIYVITQKKFIRPLYAGIYAALYEVFHLTLVLFLSQKPFPDSWIPVQQLIAPMILTNSVGLFLFSFMVHRALNYANIKDTKDKIEVELKTAHEIQLSMLPRVFPPFPDNKEFEIYALMQPAKNVGGDFYDFFKIDDNKLCFLIGDVSDKGVPAALFMTIVKTLLKTEALRGLRPDAILKRVNDILYPDNESCSFSTVFCGILNYKSGEIEFSNGGHLPPFVISKKSEPKKIPIDSNYIVGSIKEAHYTTQSIKLNKGEVIFLYTDGITEASNEKKEMYTEKRLTQALIECCVNVEHIQGVIPYIISDINKFTKYAPQFDDISIVALKYKGE